MHGDMSEGMQMVPGFNDPVWKLLLTPPLPQSCGARVPPSVAGRRCLGPPGSIKPEAEVVSSEAVRRALYSAALDFMSSAGARRQSSLGQPRPVLPQRYQQLHQPHQTIDQHPTLSYHQHQQPAVTDRRHYGRHTDHVTSFVTSSLGDLHHDRRM